MLGGKEQVRKPPSSSRSRLGRSRACGTLVEGLVVISTIGILVGLLIPDVQPVPTGEPLLTVPLGQPTGIVLNPIAVAV